MADTVLRDIEEIVEGRVIRLAERPISFDDFLDIAGGDDLELVKGVLIKRMAAQYPHERRFVWLLFLLNGYVRRYNLGTVLGSRTAVQIDMFSGRMPDLLFVRSDRQSIIQPKAIYGAPDLVIEIASPNDNPSDLIALEADYRRIGVAEIVFIDVSKRRVVVMRCSAEGDYVIEPLTAGDVAFQTVPGFHISLDALFSDPLPDEFTVLNSLLEESR
jgi:Uma2 family endonuclease